MGACLSSDVNGSSAMSPAEARALAVEQQKSKDLEASLQKQHEEQNNIIKILFLGAGESGKSTLVKQMNLLYGTGFPPAQCEKCKADLHANAIEAMKVLVLQCSRVDLPDDVAAQFRLSQAADVQEAAAHLRSIELVPLPVLDQETAEHVALLWRDAGIQAAYSMRTTFQLPDSASYLFDRVLAMAKPDYVPSTADVLRMRVRTTGVVTLPLTIKGKKFQIIDVGGQRSERKKWFHQFSNVTAVIFVAALSEYDQRMYEDESANRLTESIELFESTCNNPQLKDPAMIIFFNKLDLFAEKIAFTRAPMRPVFPDYPEAEEGNVEFAKNYIADQFRARNKRTARAEIYVHFTTAIETDHMKLVLESTQEIIINNALSASGLIV